MLLKTLIYALIVLLFSGCLYRNECGFSPYYYDSARSYYDSQGNYIIECPRDNIIRDRDLELQEFIDPMPSQVKRP